jgi:hypothetical protein
MAVARTEQFLADLSDVYNQEVEYQPTDHHPLLHLKPAKKFAKLRRDRVATYLRKPELAEDGPRAFISEWATFLAISKPLDELGFTVEMAPQGLEAGDDKRKGIDVVIAKRGEGPAVPLLGINVKLRTRNIEKSRETQRFDSKICAPMISLSLGSWRAENRQQLEAFDIRTWMDGHAIPNITSSGKLPQFHQFRRFVFSRITDTLEQYLWRTESHRAGFYDTTRLEGEKQDHEKYLFPNDPRDMESFYEKLITAHAVFRELAIKA